ncbi:MAG: hypothetical protein KJ000_18710 [Pirellulaceae bacterium]|nr:hypothetical protein [Pirellulaceae bacterium]
MTKPAKSAGGAAIARLWFRVQVRFALKEFPMHSGHLGRCLALLLAGALFCADRTADGGGYGHGCGTLPVPSCYAPAPVATTCCRCCVPCCGGCLHGKHARDRDRGAERNAQADYRSAAPLPIVSSMPVFTAPMMFASVPVVPTAATRSAEPVYRSESDCHERLNRLEDNVLELSRAMRELQAIVKDQSRVLEKITDELKK